MIDSPRLVELDIADRKFVRVADRDLIAQYNQYRWARDARSREREREFENIRMFAGVDNSAWPEELQRYMLDEDRGNNFGRFIHLGQYNFLKTKIEGIAGSIARNPFDADYVADSDQYSPLTMALKDAYLSDKELMDWQLAQLHSYLAGLIYQSCIRMYVKTEHPASPMGNIALECMPPGSVIIDPNWKTGNTRDIRDVWTLTWMTPEAMKQKYEANSELIDTEIWLQSQFGMQYEQDSVDWNRDIPERHGDQYLVVQHNYLKKEKITREICPRTGTVFWEWMDDEAKARLAEEEGVEADEIRKVTVWDDVEYIYAFSPSLSTSFPLLKETKARFQIGRLKHFPWSPAWVNGVPLPMLDQLRDAQLEINKRVATISLAAESVVTAGDYIDEAVFGMDQEKIAEHKANKGNPRYTAVLKAGTSRAFPNGIGALPRQQIPGDLFGITNMMIDLMDRLVPQPAASEGRTERSGESGILFAQKIEVAKTMQTTMLAGVRQQTNDIAEAYFFLAKQAYSQGRRVFTDAKGTNRIVINDPKIDPATGEEYVDNDFSALPRHRVVISEAPAGVNNRLAQRELNATLMQTYAGLPLVSTVFAEAMIKSLDLNEVEKSTAIEMMQKERDKLVAAADAELANARVAQQQAESMLGGGGQPQLPGPGAPMDVEGGGGAPMQGMPPEELPQQFQGEQPALMPGIGLPPTTYPR